MNSLPSDKNRIFKPKFTIQLEPKNFPPGQVVCLGSQLIAIVNCIKHTLAPHTWYGADIIAVGKEIKKHNLSRVFLKEIGTDLSMIELCSGTDQFLSGVFLAIRNEFSNQKLDNIEADTEDEEFRPLNIGGVLIEIRAFDTSFFEIFSEDELLIKKISDTFGLSR